MSFMVVERVRMAHIVDDNAIVIAHALDCPCGQCPPPGNVEDRTYLRMHGFSKPTIFKTLRNAMRAARDWFGTPRRGFVVKFDPSLLPIVFDAERDDVPMRDGGGRSVTVYRDTPTWEVDPHEADDLDAEFALAERQMLLWQERMVKVKALIDAAPITPHRPKRRRRNALNRSTEE